MEKEIVNLSDEALYRLCQEYGVNAQQWLRKFGGLLPEVFRRRLYKRRGFESIHHFAKVVGGMNERTVDKILNLAKTLEDKPFLRYQLESGNQGWSKIEKVASIATSENEAELAKKVEELPQRSLVIYVQSLRNTTTVESQGEEVSEICQRGRSFNQLSFAISPKVEQRMRVFKRRLEVEKKEALTWNQFFDIWLKRNVAEPASCIGSATKKGVEARTRHIPKDVKRVIEMRSRGGCEVGGCKKPAEHFHHRERWALVKNHNSEKIAHLCKGHHDLVHDGLIINENESPETWEIGKRVVVDRAKESVDKKVKEKRRAIFSPYSCGACPEGFGQ